MADRQAATLPHYGLPPLPALPCPEMRGPTPWSNWVIRGRVLAGAYPASLDDFETERILTTLLELGVNTFVCLQAEFALHTPETAWRSGQGLRPYIKDAQRLLIRARETQSTRIKQDKLDFLHLPIIDGSVTSDTALSRLADDCNLRILRGERLYIHCWGGHGRTGTLVATMLARLYSLSCSNALRYTQAFHDSRKYPQGVRSPQTQVQVAQVRRLLPDPPSLRGVSYPQPTIAMTDEILRPGSAPPSPLSPGAGAAGPSLVELIEAEARSQLPVNQQRKEAIRAKQSSFAPGGASPQPSAPQQQAGLETESLTATLNRAHLGSPARDIPQQAAAGAAAPVSPARQPAQPGRPQTSPSAAAEAAQRQAGYVEQFMRQRQMAGAVGLEAPFLGAAAAAGPAPLSQHAAGSGSGGGGGGGGAGPASSTKLGSKLGSTTGGSGVVNLTARAGGGVTAVPYEEDAAGDLSGPLRPSKVTVTIPGTTGLGKPEPAAPAPASRASSVMGYINSKFR